jgi:hypothetical protein
MAGDAPGSALDAAPPSQSSLLESVADTADAAALPAEVPTAEPAEPPASTQPLDSQAANA